MAIGIGDHSRSALRLPTRSKTRQSQRFEHVCSLSNEDGDTSETCRTKKRKDTGAHWSLAFDGVLPLVSGCDLLGVMKALAYCLRLLWWLGAASLPVLFGRYYESYRYGIQCPASGDCYTPGSEYLLGIELLIAFAAITIWPLFIWHVLVQPWRERVTRRVAALNSEDNLGAGPSQ